MHKYCNMRMHQHIRVHHFMYTESCVNVFDVLCVNDFDDRKVCDHHYFSAGFQATCPLEAAFKELEIICFKISFPFFLGTASYLTLFSLMGSFGLLPSHSCISTLLLQSSSPREDSWNLPGTHLPWSTISVQLPNCEVHSNWLRTRTWTFSNQCRTKGNLPTPRFGVV